uniref:TIR domain-containing protein n=1 Tax=Globodera pallida TaxID=36090 RepID=A0A183BLG4_GLOPA
MLHNSINNLFKLNFKWAKKFKPFAITSCLLVLALAFTHGQIVSGHIHRKRDTTPTDEQQQQQQQQRQKAPFYRCPQGCDCVPDNVNIELLAVSCRWPKMRSFGQFPRGGTKSLSIFCTAGTRTNGDGDGDERGEEESANEAPFDGFNELQVLRITGCSRVRWLHSHPSQLFGSVPRLRHLHLSQMPSLRQLNAQFFAGLHTLEQFTLVATGLEQFPPDALCSMQALQVLNVSSNALPSAALSMSPSNCQLGQLIVADLSSNRIGRIRRSDLGPFPALRNLALANNALEEIDFESFDQVQLLQLLDLSKNRLISLPRLPPNTLNIDLSNNYFTQIPASVRELLELNEVNLRFNKMRTIPRELYERFVVANAPFGRLWIGENPLECNCEMNWLLNASSSAVGTAADAGGVMDVQSAECVVPLDGEGKRKRIADTTPFDFLCPYSLICVPRPDCRCCQFAECDCKSRCPAGCHCFRDLNSRTNVVKCSGDSVGSDFRLKDLPMHASHIFLSGLSLPVLKRNAFAGRERLLELHINQSGIHTIESNAFNSLPNLQALYLSDNRLKHINGSEFNEMTNIRLLDVSGNAVVEVNSKLAEKLPQLEAFHLADNSMEQMPTYLESPFGDKLRRVSLGGNPFRCDCAVRSVGRSRTPDAAHWLEANFARVLDPEGMRCVENVTGANDSTVLSSTFPNLGDDFFTMPMLEFLREENKSLCVQHKAGIFGISGVADTLLFLLTLFSGTLLLLCLALLLLRWGKFDVKRRCRLGPDSVTTTQTTRLISANNSHSLSSSHSPPTSGGSSPMPIVTQQFMPPAQEEQEVPHYLFISYHRTDEQMLVQEFCGPLERAGCSLCLLHQCGHYQPDGHQHQSINGELNQLVDQSRALIMFVTPDFLRDEWATLQVSMSHQLGNKKLIVYVSEELYNCMDKLPNELGEMIRRKARLWRYWRRHSMFDDTSWKELGKALLAIDALPKDVKSNESTAHHLYAEYGTIPQVPSAMI